MIERLQVRVPVEAAGKFSFPVLTLCADFNSVSVSPVLPQWHAKENRHSVNSASEVKPKHTYTLEPTKSQWADYAVQA